MPSPESTPSSTNSFSILRPGVWSLCGEIDHPQIQAILHAIYNHDDPGKPLLFLLESPGGLAHGTLGLLRELRHFRDLETRAIGCLASAAVHLLQAGTKRTAYPHTEFFTHAISSEATVDTTNAANMAASFEHDLDSWVDAVCRRTQKKTPRFWRSWFKTNRYFDAKEALSVGLIDEILD